MPLLPTDGPNTRFVPGVPFVVVVGRRVGEFGLTEVDAHFRRGRGG